MPHEILAGHRRLFNAVLMGERAALFVAAITMLVVFGKSAAKYFAGLAHRRPPIFADVLGAGIWLTAAGLVLGEAVQLTLTTIWPKFLLAPLLVGFGVLTILAGYVLHFMAWAAVVHPRLRHLSLYWVTGLALVAAAGMTLAFRLE